MHSGISFLGKHSYNDFNITMSNEREIGIPNKKKSKLSLPFSNAVYDYSDVFGEQTYEERQIKYTFNIADREIETKEEMNWVKTTLINWLMKSGGKQKLYDPFYPGFHFLAEVEGSSKFVENWTYGFLEVTFTAYPFMISNNVEGNDIWNEFNFLTDVVQNTQYTIPTSVYDYKQLATGSLATIGAWATGAVGGRPGELSNWVGTTGKILARYDIEGSLSKRQYDIEGFSERIYEQDIVQACNKYKDVILVNQGSSSVFPELYLTNAITAYGGPGVSVHDLDTGMIYNFIGNNPINYLFQLKPGNTRLRLYHGVNGGDHTINFKFRKELI